ncbi:MAG: MAPEG family protein [Pseudomonadota bacterium]
MTYELWILVTCALLGLLFPFVYNWHYGRQVGGKALLGNRDNLPERIGVAARGYRAHQNHLENLLPFAIVVLVINQAGISNAITIFGAVLFLIARIVHATTYIAGIPGPRPVAWFAGLIGTLLVASQLVYYIG